MLLAMSAAVTGTAAVPGAQPAMGGDPDAFEFRLEQTESHRGLGVQGYVHNALPWRIANVRLRVDSLDPNGALIASASDWVPGNVTAGGRGFFYVAIEAPAPTYRVSVQAFDKIMRDPPAPQAP